MLILTYPKSSAVEASTIIPTFRNKLKAQRGAVTCPRPHSLYLLKEEGLQVRMSTSPLSALKVCP